MPVSSEPVKVHDGGQVNGPRLEISKGTSIWDKIDLRTTMYVNNKQQQNSYKWKWTAISLQ